MQFRVLEVGEQKCLLIKREVEVEGSCDECNPDIGIDTPYLLEFWLDSEHTPILKIRYKLKSMRDDVFEKMDEERTKELVETLGYD